MSHSFSYSTDSGSTWTDCATYGLMVASIPKWPFFGNLAGRAGDLYYADGGALHAEHFGISELTLNCVIRAADSTELATFRDNLRSILDPRLGDGWIKIDYQTDRFYVGRLMAGVDWEHLAMHAGQITLPFKLSKACAYASSETVQTIAVAASPQSFDVPDGSGEVVGGTAEVRPVWVIKNTSGGTSGALTLANATTGETFSTTAGIANGAWLRIDSERQHVEISTDSGVTWTTAMSNVNSPWLPTLQPGVQNELTLTGLTAGSVVCTYRTRYL